MNKKHLFSITILVLPAYNEYFAGAQEVFIATGAAADASACWM